MRFIPTFLRSYSIFRHINKRDANTTKPYLGRRGLFIATFLLTLAAFGGYFALPLTLNAAAVAPQELVKSVVQADPGPTKQTGVSFGYRLTYNCSNPAGPCSNAQVVDLLPPEVEFLSTVPASPTGDVQAINVTPNFMGSGRTRVQFMMLSSLPAGSSGDLLINVRFPNGSTADGTQAANTADGINLGAVQGTFTTPPATVTAVATVQVNLTKTLTTSPANLDMPESYRLRISAPNSNGALNLTAIGPVVDTLPPGTVFNGATPAADCQPGCVGTTPATVTWTSPCSVPLQPNQNCDISVNVTFPSATFPSGAGVTNSFTADATPLGKPSQNLGMSQVMHSVTTFIPNASAGFTKNMAGGTPNPPALNQAFSYDLNPSNNGNVPLDNLVIIDTLPVEMQVTSVTTGAYSGLADFAVGAGVRVSYEKNTALGVFTLWGSSLNTTTNTGLTVPPPGLGMGEYITRIRWEYGQAQPGMSAATRPLITGMIVNPDNSGGPVAIGDTIQNCAALSAVYTAGPANVNRNDCESFTLSGPFVQLNPAKDNLSGGGPFNPGQSVSWRLRVRSDARSSDPLPLENIAATDLLPANLNFSSWTFDDRGTGLPAPQVFDQIPNYAGTGRTLLRWRWNAGSGNLGVNQEVWVNITTTVRNGAPAGSLSNDVTLDSDAPGLGLRCAGSSQADSLDLDGDGNTAETLCRATGTINVASIAQLVSSKTVQGACDGGHVSNSAGTLPGGPISYSMRVQNVGTVAMQNFVLIDILPFVGDTGVRDTNPRGSQFTPLLVEPITPPSGTVIYYSTSGNPCRGEVGGPTTSCEPPNWSTVAPSPITSVRSIKVEFGNRVIQPYDFLEFTFNMTAPASLPPGATAFNSFAYQADRADGLGSLAAEPQKVGIALGSCEAASLGDFVFADANGNGIQDDGASGLNSVMMRLFMPGDDGLQGTLDDIPLGATVTANGPDSAPGWYSFPGLAPGSYFVCASLPANYFFSPPNATSGSLDSDAAPATGCSGIVTLGVNQSNNDIDFGLIPAQFASIGNYVWFDLNGDGIQNESPSEGANGVTVQLYARNGSDTLVATTVTANDESNRPGYYSFGGLTPGQQYFVQFALPASATAFTTADAGGNDTVDSDATTGTGATTVVTLAAGEFNRTLDAGLLKPSGTLALGDQVWLDADNDGVFEPQNGENGINDVLLHLYLDANSNGLPDAGEYAGQTLTGTVSGFSGRYSFGGLAPGTYIVVIPASNFAGGGALFGRTSSTGNSPAPDPDDDANGDDNGTTVGAVLGSLPVTLTDNGEPTSEDGNNDTNLTVDFGFIAGNATLAPTISKAFGAALVPVSATTTLTFTIANPNGTPLSDIGFIDPLPAGLVVATPNGLTGTCVGTPADAAVLTPGSAAAVAGSSGISLSSLALAGGSACTLTVNTTATTSGAKHNRTGNVIAAEGVIGGTASATLEVNSSPAITPINLSRAAGSPALTTTIATATDVEDSEDRLVIQISTDGVNFFDSISTGNVMVALVDQNGGATGVNPTAAGAVIATITAPCNATAGPINLTLRATDTGGRMGTTAWTLTITPNPSPVLTYNNQTIPAGTTPIINPAAGPDDNGTINPLSLDSISPATGLALSLNPVSGQILVTGATLAGEYTVIVSATDDCGATTTGSFIVTVGCPPITMTPVNLPDSAVNTTYIQTISATPANPNYSFGVTSGALPPGLTLNSNGTFSGAPAQSGTFNFRVMATVFGGCATFRDYTLIVNCPGLTVNPASLPGGSVGTAYSQTVSGSPAGTYNYAVTSGALPPGLTLNASTGAITGTPVTTGSFSFTIAATAGGCSGSRSYTVAINCPAIALSPASPLPSGQAGVTYSQTVSASPAGSYTFSLASGSLPSGLTLNPATGVISGLSSRVGSFTFTVKAQSASGCNATQSYTLAITCPSVALSPATMPEGATGAAYSQTVSASPAGGNYTYAVTSGSLPAGLTLNPSTGILSGTPAGNGSFTFRITATGFGGCTGFRDYSMVIGGGGCPAITLPATLPNGSAGQLYNTAATASPAGLYSYTVTSGSLPPGVTLFGANGLLFGYPTAVGSYSFTIAATQGACSGSKMYTVLIGAGFASSLTVFSDFDGDGKSDLSVFRGSDGNWLVANSGDGQSQSTAWGSSAAPYNDVTVSGDYDGDGKTDLAVFRRGGEHAGYWFIKRSSDGGVSSHFWGLPTDIPVPGDYDGDGKTDVAVWRGSAGAWYIVRSSDGGIEAKAWGYGPAGDIPVPGDYDGDSKTDVAVFRRSTGFWHIHRSSDSVTISAEWGVGTDVPVPGDYDGDNRTDIAVWRASEGAWHIIESASALLKTLSLGAAAPGDVPVVADYDGDGKADAAVWRASTGTWIVKQSRQGVEMSKTFGQSGDVPIVAKRNN